MGKRPIHRITRAEIWQDPNYLYDPDFLKVGRKIDLDIDGDSFGIFMLKRIGGVCNLEDQDITAGSQILILEHQLKEALVTDGMHELLFGADYGYAGDFDTEVEVCTMGDVWEWKVDVSDTYEDVVFSFCLSKSEMKKIVSSLN